MAEAVEPTGSDTAEKAYAAAAELAISQADATKSEPDTELQFPAKTKRIILPAASEAAVATALPEIVVPAELEADLMMKARPTAKQAPTKKVRTAKIAKSAPAAAKKSAIGKKSAVAVSKAAIIGKPAALAAPKFKTPAKIKTTAKSQPAFKDTTMTTKKTKDYTATIKSAAADVQTKAKLALSKGSAVLGEASTFTKANVEALVTSGKILGTGLKGLGKIYAAEGKSAYSTVTADVKELTQVKSPVEFVRLQTSILRRNLDHALDFGGKNGEQVIKLAGEVFAPISARASLAVQKVTKAA
jgi:hypothetical protein